MLDVRDVQIPPTFVCPMEAGFYVTRGGWHTNVKGYAEITWFDAPPDEVMCYRRLVSARLSRMLAVISATTLAEDWGIGYRTVVRLARWSEQSMYRCPPWSLVRAVYEDLFETKIQ